MSPSEHLESIVTRRCANTGESRDAARAKIVEAMGDLAAEREKAPGNWSTAWLAEPTEEPTDEQLAELRALPEVCWPLATRFPPGCLVRTRPGSGVEHQIPAPGTCGHRRVVDGGRERRRPLSPGGGVPRACLRRRSRGRRLLARLDPGTRAGGARSMSKPNPAAVRASSPLSIIPLTADRMACCNVCGKPADALEAWRAHDERDRPIDGPRALVFLGAGDAHKACRKKLDAHARLFAPDRGFAGHWPFCGPCTFRQGLECRNPDAKANGGAGVRVELAGIPATVCFGRGRGGCRRLQHVVGCAGLTVKSEEKTG